MAASPVLAPSSVAMSAGSPLRAWLLRWVQGGTDTVAAFQRACGITLVPAARPGKEATVRVSNRLLNVWFLTSAAAGNELFYIVFLPFLFWCVDYALARRVVMLWWIVYFVGQSAKDMLRLPRPPCPPVAKLETHYETEYGFPSTHAMIALVLPFYALLTSWELGYQIDPLWGGMAAALWTTSITLSRLYVGVHSPCDLVGGLGLGAIVLAFGAVAGTPLDHFIAEHAFAPLAAALLSFVTIYLYPAPLAWTNAYGDTALIIATATGIFWGCASFLPKHEVPPMIASAATDDAGDASLSERATLLAFAVLLRLCRMLVGCSVLFLTRSVMKKCAQQVWLPLVLPKYFTFCSLLDSPTHEELPPLVNEASKGPDAGDQVGSGHHKRAVSSSSSSSSSSTHSTPDDDGGTWEITHMNAAAPPQNEVAATLHQRKQQPSKGHRAAARSTDNGVDVPANASLSAPTTDGAARIVSPQPLRPAAPQQFRLRVSTNSSSFNGPAVGSGTGSPSSPLPPLGVLLRKPSPPHQLSLTDPSDPRTRLASFRFGARDIVINPLHVYLCEIPIKYVTYFSVGFNAVCVCPLLFKWMGI